MGWPNAINGDGIIHGRRHVGHHEVLHVPSWQRLGWIADHAWSDEDALPAMHLGTEIRIEDLLTVARPDSL